MSGAGVADAFMGRPYWSMPFAVAFAIEDEAARASACDDAAAVLDYYPNDKTFRSYTASSARCVVERALGVGAEPVAQDADGDEELIEARGAALYRSLERGIMDAIAAGDVLTWGRPSKDAPIRPIAAHEWVNAMVYYGATADLGPASDYDPRRLDCILSDQAKPAPWYWEIMVGRDSLLAWLRRAPIQSHEKSTPRLGRKPIDDSKVVGRAHAIALEKGETAKDAALVAISEIYPDGLAKLPGTGSDDSKLLRITTKVQALLDGTR